MYSILKHNQYYILIDVFFFSQDQKGNQMYLGVTHLGIVTFQGNKRTHLFKWSVKNSFYCLFSLVFFKHLSLNSIHIYICFLHYIPELSKCIKMHSFLLFRDKGNTCHNAKSSVQFIELPMTQQKKTFVVGSTSLELSQIDECNVVC